MSMAGGFAWTTEAWPNRADADWTELRTAGCLIKDLKAVVDYLNILRRAHLTIGVGRSAVACDSRIWDAVKIEKRARHAGHRHVWQYVEPILNNGVRTVFVVVRNLWVLVRLALSLRHHGMRFHFPERN